MTAPAMRIRATDDTRAAWSEARDRAYALGHGERFDEICGLIELKMAGFPHASAEMQDRILQDVGDLAGQRRALLTGGDA